MDLTLNAYIGLIWSHACPVIFILNKNPSESRRLLRLIRSDGFESVVFSDTDKILVAIKKQKPACLIASIETADFDSKTHYEDLLKLMPQLPVIIISDSGEVSDAVKAIRAGCFDYIEKPILDRQLLVRLHDAVGLGQNKGS